LKMLIIAAGFFAEPLWPHYQFYCSSRETHGAYGGANG
jgi:hypothetical protein